MADITVVYLTEYIGKSWVSVYIENVEIKDGHPERNTIARHLAEFALQALNGNEIKIMLSRGEVFNDFIVKAIKKLWNNDVEVSIEPSVLNPANPDHTFSPFTLKYLITKDDSDSREKNMSQMDILSTIIGDIGGVLSPNEIANIFGDPAKMNKIDNIFIEGFDNDLTTEQIMKKIVEDKELINRS